MSLTMVSYPMTKQVLGNTRAFSANVGAFVSTTAYVPANWSSLSRMAGALKGGLSTFATDISNVTCISRVSDATDANSRWPTCSGANEPDSTAPSGLPLGVIVPSARTRTVSMRARH